MAGRKNDWRGLLGIVSVLLGWLLVVVPRVASQPTNDRDVATASPDDVNVEVRQTDASPFSAPSGASFNSPSGDTAWTGASGDRTAGGTSRWTAAPANSQPNSPATTPATRTTTPAAATGNSSARLGWPAKVIGISDGDTIDVLNADNQKFRLRLNAIDCPETGQPFGANAKQFVSQTVGGQMVQIVEHDRDRYGRIVAEVYDSSSRSLNVALVRAGLAWHYKAYAADRADVAAAEAEARSQLRGLWGGSHQVIPPWNWRKLSKLERDQYR